MLMLAVLSSSNLYAQYGLGSVTPNVPATVTPPAGDAPVKIERPETPAAGGEPGFNNNPFTGLDVK